MIKSSKITATVGLIFAVLFVHSQVRAETVEYRLTIAREEVNITGKTARAMTVNGGIPGPTLTLKEGDVARIHVHNKMNVETSVHWHGMLVPPDMDGVPDVSFPPIKTDTTFTYEFPIRQSGTYWYHSHTSLQEQSGVYGSIVIRVPAIGAYEFRATAHDGSGYASVWIGSGQRHPAPDVPKPNLYHTMGDLSLKKLFALTPAGSMGMSDGEVDAGKFDRPGMAGMGSMNMGNAKDKGSMDMSNMPGMEDMNNSAASCTLR